MLVATFSDATAWAGRRITHEDGRFLLQGFGHIAAAQVLEYDRVTPLVWTTEGTRAWVRSVAQREAAAAPAAVETPSGAGEAGAAGARAGDAGAAAAAPATAATRADLVPSECRFGRSHYVGGQPSLGAAAGGALRVTPTSLLVEAPGGDPELTLPLADVVGVSLYGGSTAAAAGVAAPVSREGTFLIAHLRPSGYAAFAVDGEEPGEVREALAPVLAQAGVPLQEHVPGAPIRRTSGVGDAAGLHAAGVLSDHEFRARVSPVAGAPGDEAGADRGRGGPPSADAPRKVPAGARELALERLRQLRLSGAISDAELSSMRAKLLE